jgi:hypothetical protein
MPADLPGLRVATDRVGDTPRSMGALVTARTACSLIRSERFRTLDASSRRRHPPSEGSGGPFNILQIQVLPHQNVDRELYAWGESV